jgi:CCR4-NOT transcription complex subunit 2
VRNNVKSANPNRRWGFHKELKAWLMRVANTEPVMKTERGERGSFWIFDVLSWWGCTS